MAFSEEARKVETTRAEYGLENESSNSIQKEGNDQHFIMSSWFQHEASTNGIMAEFGSSTLFHQSTAELGIAMVYDSDGFAGGVHFNT
jgi:hypothetical protein